MKLVTAGVDIGGTYTKFGVVDQKGNVLFHAETSTPDYSDFTGLLKYLKRQITDGVTKLDEPVELLGVGFGAPNANFYRGTIEYAPNLTWKGIIPVVELASESFNLPVEIENDANASAIGEKIYGIAKNIDDFVVVTLGTGLGCGIISNGQIVRGHDGFAGEIGHSTVNPDGRMCNCGKSGCLETYVSATGIRRTVYKLLADHLEDSEMRKVSFDDLSTTMITEAAERGDKIALEAFEYTGQILGAKLADTIVHLNPEAIILTGGLSKAGEFIFRPTIEHIEKNLAESISHLRLSLIYHSRKRTCSSKEYKEKQRESKLIQSILNSLITLDQRLIYGIKKG